MLYTMCSKLILCCIPGVGCPIIKFTFLKDKCLSPLTLFRDCLVLKIYVLIWPIKRTMFECSSMFTLQIMKHSIAYLCFQGFYVANFNGPENLKYFRMSWIWPPIIFFGVYTFIKMGNIINFVFLQIFN